VGVEEEDGAVARALVARAPAALWEVLSDIVEAEDEVLGMVVIALELWERTAPGGGGAEAMGSGGVEVSPT